MDQSFNNAPRLDHENLDVYQCALRFLAFAFEINSALPRGDSELRDQLKRAAISIVLNIAEGAGKSSVTDRARFHAIARGSAMECGALVDIAVLLGKVDEAKAQVGKTLLVRIVAMLTKMCRLWLSYSNAVNSTSLALPFP